MIVSGQKIFFQSCLALSFKVELVTMTMKGEQILRFSNFDSGLRILQTRVQDGEVHFRMSRMSPSRLHKESGERRAESGAVEGFNALDYQ
jgi:hypothetical protein